MSPPLLMASARLSAVSFDVDGTLYDYSRHRVHLLPSLLRHPRVLPAFQETVRALRGEAHPDLRRVVCERVGARVGLPWERVSRVLDDTVYGAWPASFRPTTALPGLRELLDRLDALGIPRVVVSDFPAEGKLDGMGLGGWAAVVDCERVGAYKPHPAGLAAAAASLGLAPDQLVHVGDRVDTDAAMADAVGAPSLIRGRDWTHTEQLGRLLLGRAWADDTPRRPDV